MRLLLSVLSAGVALAPLSAPRAAPSAASPPYWAFVPPVRPALPAVTDPHWPRNAIDYFILARLDREHARPSPEADRETQIRRLSLDLTGLPPAPEEVAAFLQDRAPGAYERVVERLLASPHYGERWGRHWLDAARYADSNGYSIDAPRSIWSFRDWVIRALNADLPFDQFAVAQLAGDLLPGATLEQKIATGFHRNTQVNQEGGIDPEQFRVESVLDRVNTTGSVFLGLTIGCAQCHDHKFDPITQQEYYRLFAFFNNTIEDGHGKGAPDGMLEVPGQVENPESSQRDLAEAEGDLGRYLDNKGSKVAEWEASLTDEKAARLPEIVRRARGAPWTERTTAQKRAAYAAFRADAPDPDFNSRVARVAKLEKREPKPSTTLVMTERTEPRATFVLIQGDFTRPGKKVTPGVPAVFGLPLRTAAGGADRGTEGGADAPPRVPSRLDLAQWLVDPKNPLTARVTVNRVWQQYFGRGLVETENDFGTQGSPPSHPELLDWLAVEFMRPGFGAGEVFAPSTGSGQSASTGSGHGPGPAAWSLKHLHRLIVTSAAYRQSSRARPELAVLDPNNKLLARQARLRLDAEIVRDVCLSASGLLEERVGGPSVFPPQPDGVMKLGQLKRDWKAGTGADRYRRGLYTHWWRATPHPALSVFDSPDAFTTCTRRVRPNTPLQALTLLNDEAFVEFAQAFARRLLRDGPSSDAGRLDLAFRLCLARAPHPDEQQRLLQLIETERGNLTESPADAAALANRPKDWPAGVDRLAVWTTVSRVLLNLDETITRE